jgi:ribosomal protein S12 methylthiotransferase
LLIEASPYYLKVGEFVSVEITEAGDFDLYGVPQGVPPLKK